MDLLITYQLRRETGKAVTIETKLIREVHMRTDDEIEEKILENLDETISAILTEIDK